MKIDTLPIPKSLRDAYRDLHIEELYPPQEECVKAGLFERKNILAAIPTASGKTLIAEMAMQSEIAKGGKCLYIVPLKALASEKYDDFSGKGVSVGIATGDPDQRDEYLGRYDIIVATSEKTDSLLRNKAKWVENVSLLVVDEIHLIGDESRGATLEMVIAKMRYLNPNLQIIGLSATMGNPEELAKWLDAELITSEWRPVDLREGVFFQGKIKFKDSEREVPAIKKDDDVNLLLDTVAEGGQCLVFVSSRRSAEAFAKKAAVALKKNSKELDHYAEIIAKADTTASGKTLAETVRKGAAFHHAGLPRAARAAVEEGFRKGDILSISSTPTLAAGLNLPARRVIVRDYQRYDAATGMNMIPVMEYRQMAGRAGRPRLDPYGEAILIAKDETRVQELYDEFISAPAEDIFSQCQRENELRTHLLALITTGFTSTRDEIFEFMRRSFYASQKAVHRRLDHNIKKALEFLRDAEMIDETDTGFTYTSFGSLSSRLYLEPESAMMIKSVLAFHRDDEFSPFGVLHLLCMTPDMFRFYLKVADEKLVDSVTRDRGDEIWFEEWSEEFFGAIKTALVIEEWANEVPEDMIAERFGVGGGDVHAAVETLKWLLHATKRIVHEFSPSMEPDIEKLELRVANGIKEELIPLISLKGIGRVRARRLFARGITCPEDVVHASKSDIVSILGVATAETALKEARRLCGVKDDCCANESFEQEVDVERESSVMQKSNIEQDLSETDEATPTKSKPKAETKARADTKAKADAKAKTQQPTLFDF